MREVLTQEVVLDYVAESLAQLEIPYFAPDEQKEACRQFSEGYKGVFPGSRESRTCQVDGSDGFFKYLASLIIEKSDGQIHLRNHNAPYQPVMGPHRWFSLSRLSGHNDMIAATGFYGPYAPPIDWLEVRTPSGLIIKQYGAD